MKRTENLRILFLVRSLDQGGAERQLVALARALHKKGHQISVAIFYPDGAFESELKEAQIRVLCLNKEGRWDVLRFFLRLLGVVRDARPQILHSYLTGANILACFVKLIYPAVTVVWGLRGSYMDMSRYDWLASFTYRIEPYLSRLPDFIIVNSYAGLETAVQRGFPGEKIRVIHNGIDCDRFRPDAAAGKKLRAEWRIRESDILIGLIGRLNPMKDHPTFLRAAAIIARERADVRFVCVGRGTEKYQTKLRAVCDELELSERVIWAGARTDMSAVFNALDIVCSASSFGEGFPNVIGEAMACGKPCVVTDVGDSALIVGDLGMVVPPRDPQALANALRTCLTKETRGLAAAIRERIVRRFSLVTLADRTEHELIKQMNCK